MFGDTLVPNIGCDYILLLGYSSLYKEHNLTRFNHKKHYSHVSYSLNSLKGHAGDYVGEYEKGY